MKKWMALLAAAMMMLLCMTALAEDSLKVVDEVAFAVTDEANDRALIYVVLEVENTSNEEKSLGYQSSFSVMHQNGKEYSDGTFLSLYPQSIKPGEKGYIVPSTYSLTDFKTFDQVADYSYDLVADEPSYFTCSKYETTLEERDGKTLIKMTNPTSDTLYNPSVVVVYRGEGGELLHLESNYLYDYGIPAGMSVYVDMTPRREVREFFENNGIEIHAAENFAYVTVYKY